ncbi:hypothetical protein ABPG72_014320 [Tetrahymena utriculariae]
MILKILINKFHFIQKYIYYILLQLQSQFCLMFTQKKQKAQISKSQILRKLQSNYLNIYFIYLLIESQNFQTNIFFFFISLKSNRNISDKWWAKLLFISSQFLHSGPCLQVNMQQPKSYQFRIKIQPMPKSKGVNIEEVIMSDKLTAVKVSRLQVEFLLQAWHYSLEPPFQVKQLGSHDQHLLSQIQILCMYHKQLYMYELIGQVCKLSSLSQKSYYKPVFRGQL